MQAAKGETQGSARSRMFMAPGSSFCYRSVRCEMYSAPKGANDEIVARVYKYSAPDGAAGAPISNR
jgi:hypothetical protein